MEIKTIAFKRHENANWEAGIMIECLGSLNNQIIDNSGTIVPNIVFDYDDTDHFKLNLTPIFNRIEKDANGY